MKDGLWNKINMQMDSIKFIATATNANTSERKSEIPHDQNFKINWFCTQNNMNGSGITMKGLKKQTEKERRTATK